MQRRNEYLTLGRCAFHDHEAAIETCDLLQRRFPYTCNFQIRRQHQRVLLTRTRLPGPGPGLDHEVPACPSGGLRVFQDTDDLDAPSIDEVAGDLALLPVEVRGSEPCTTGEQGEEHRKLIHPRIEAGPRAMEESFCAPRMPPPTSSPRGRETPPRRTPAGCLPARPRTLTTCPHGRLLRRRRGHADRPRCRPGPRRRHVRAGRVPAGDGADETGAAGVPERPVGRGTGTSESCTSAA